MISIIILGWVVAIAAVLHMPSKAPFYLLFCPPPTLSLPHCFLANLPGMETVKFWQQMTLQGQHTVSAWSAWWARTRKLCIIINDWKKRFLPLACYHWAMPTWNTIKVLSKVYQAASSALAASHLLMMLSTSNKLPYLYSIVTVTKNESCFGLEKLWPLVEGRKSSGSLWAFDGQWTHAVCVETNSALWWQTQKYSGCCNHHSHPHSFSIIIF